MASFRGIMPLFGTYPIFFNRCSLSEFEYLNRTFLHIGQQRLLDFDPTEGIFFRFFGFFDL